MEQHISEYLSRSALILENMKASENKRFKAEGYQKYPASRIKVGAVLYKVVAFSYVEGGSGSELEEWHIRSIRKKRGSQTINGRKCYSANLPSNQRNAVNCVSKIKGVTWGKLSTKNGDFGFFKNISQSYKKQFMDDSDYLPHGFFTTVLAATRFAYKHQVKVLKQSEKDLKELERLRDNGEFYSPDELELELGFVKDLTAEVKLLKSRLTKAIKASKSKKLKIK